MLYIILYIAMNGEKISVKSHRDGQPECSVPTISDNSNTCSEPKVSTGVLHKKYVYTVIQCIYTTAGCG